MSNVEIKLLNPKHDFDTLEAAWQWQNDAPQWFQDSQDADNGTFKDFLMSDSAMYGVIVESSPMAIIRLNPAGNGVYSIDLLARRSTDMDILTQAGKSVKKYLFEHNVKAFFGWIPSLNRGIISLYKSLGFEHRGVICYRGKYHNKRPIKWLLMESLKSN